MTDLVFRKQPRRMEVLFSAIIRLRESTLYVDVKNSSNGKPYLSVSESGTIQGKPYRSTVRVFGRENIAQFLDFVNEAGELAIDRLTSKGS